MKNIQKKSSDIKKPHLKGKNTEKKTRIFFTNVVSSYNKPKVEFKMDDRFECFCSKKFGKLLDFNANRYGFKNHNDWCRFVISKHIGIHTQPHVVSDLKEKRVKHFDRIAFRCTSRFKKLLKRNAVNNGFKNNAEYCRAILANRMGLLD